MGGSLLPLQEDIKRTERKVIQGNEKLEQIKGQLMSEMEIAQTLKQEIQTKTAESDKYLPPMNELKKKMAALDTERKNAHRAASSKQKFIDRGKKKIKQY